MAIWEGDLLHVDGIEWRCLLSCSRYHPYQSSSLGRRRKRGAFCHAIGRSRGGRTSKIHAVTDENGRPLAFVVTVGNAVFAMGRASSGRAANHWRSEW